MGRRGDHSFKEISDMILDAAQEIVENDGYLKLSTRKIATKIGYTVGTLYNAYKNLDDIILHLNGRTLDSLLEKIQITLKNNKNDRLVFKKVGLAYAEFSQEHFNQWDLLSNYRFSEKTEIPKWYPNKVQEIFKTLESQLSNIIPNKTPTEINNAISVMWASVHGICALSIKGKFDHTQGLNKAETLIENFITNYFKGLGLKA